MGTVHAAELLVRLRYFRKQIGRPLRLVWDHRNVDRARVVRDFLVGHPTDFPLAWLPGYAREFNPEEQCNRWVKQDVLDALPSSIEHPHQLVGGRYERLQLRPELLLHFVKHADLNIN